MSEESDLPQTPSQRIQPLTPDYGSVDRLSAAASVNGNGNSHSPDRQPIPPESEPSPEYGLTPESENPAEYRAGHESYHLPTAFYRDRLDESERQPRRPFVATLVERDPKHLGLLKPKLEPEELEKLDRVQTRNQILCVIGLVVLSPLAAGPIGTSIAMFVSWFLGFLLLVIALGTCEKKDKRRICIWAWSFCGVGAVCTVISSVLWVVFVFVVWPVWNG